MFSKAVEVVKRGVTLPQRAAKTKSSFFLQSEGKVFAPHTADSWEKHKEETIFDLKENIDAELWNKSSPVISPEISVSVFTGRTYRDKSSEKEILFKLEQNWFYWRISLLLNIRNHF